MTTTSGAEKLSAIGTNPAAAIQTRAWDSSPKPTSSKRANYIYSDDASLIQSCLDGDELAWEKLVHRYATLVFSIPRRLGLSVADADDVLQNVFTIAFRRLSSLKNHQCMAAWLITITRRECLHHSKRTREHAELVEEITEGGQPLSDSVERQQRCLLVHQALTLLDSNSQALLSALFLELPTPSYEAIAKRLDMAVGSIGPARARSLKKLQTILLGMDTGTFSAIVDE